LYDINEGKSNVVEPIYLEKVDY